MASIPPRNLRKKLLRFQWGCGSGFGGFNETAEVASAAPMRLWKRLRWFQWDCGIHKKKFLRASTPCRRITSGRPHSAGAHYLASPLPRSALEGVPAQQEHHWRASTSCRRKFSPGHPPPRRRETLKRCQRSIHNTYCMLKFCIWRRH
jgi:hypothetical protein